METAIYLLVSMLIAIIAFVFGFKLGVEAMRKKMLDEINELELTDIPKEYPVSSFQDKLRQRIEEAEAKRKTA